MQATLHKCQWMDKHSGMAIAEIDKIPIELPKEGRLEFLQKIVDGYIEVVHVDGRDWVVNEEGLLHGLPLNPASPKGFHLVGNIVEIHGRLP